LVWFGLWALGGDLGQQKSVLWRPPPNFGTEPLIELCGAGAILFGLREIETAFLGYFNGLGVNFGLMARLEFSKKFQRILKTCHFASLSFWRKLNDVKKEWKWK
jgi:hypothetical protein